MNAAVFLEPSAPLAALVLERKAHARTHWPDATYLDHPVHGTVIAGEFDSVDRWEAALGAVVARHSPFTITCSGTMLFADDPATGGTTVALALEAAPALFALQAAIAAAVAPFRDRAVADRLAERLAVGGTRAAAESARAFGFPWVGSHWRPHLTIGSFLVSSNDPRLAPLRAPFAPIVMEVREVGLWKIRGELHERRRSLPLMGTR